MAGATATTIYDVITRYHVQNAGAAEMAGYSNSVSRASRRSATLTRSTGRLTRSFSMLGRALGPIVGGAGVIGVAGFGIAAAKGFGNLNRELNATITLASQLNLGFKYTEDPAENFVASMTKARGVFKDLVKDAAALPGEVNDFLGIARMIGVPTFMAGGSTDQFRQLIGKIALATPSTGGSFDTAGLGVMKMLQGRGIRRNPLTAFMESGKLLQGMSLEQYNKQSPAERLRILDEGLSKLVDNPMFRSAVLNTFDTQMGTLSETIFGVTGIMGQFLAGPFESALKALTDYNRELEDKVPGIVTELNQFTMAMKDLWTVLTGGGGLASGPIGFLNAMNTKFATGVLGGLEKTADYLKWQPPERESRGWRNAWGAFSSDDEKSAEIASYKAFMEHQGVMRDLVKNPVFPEKGVDPIERALYESMTGRGELDGEFREKGAVAKVIQNFTVKVAVSTDESPEAVAVKIRDALGRATATPTVAGRGVRLLPTGGAGAGTAAA
jgi:hypothetical protein